MNGPQGKPGGQAHCATDSHTELCDEREAARRLGLSVATLRRRRRLQQPPSWVKLGSRVLYRKQDIESFIDANLVPLPANGREDKR
jgi:predicted DNA-binding transcriptional regulator AlpA